MKKNMYGDLSVISGNSNIPLAKEICEHLGVELSDTAVNHFKDGEINLNIADSARGADVFIIQPTSKPVNDNLMELLILIDALKRASAGRINAVIPYYGYARQDRKTKAREPITSKLVADLLATAGADRVITMDLHAGQIQGFFDIPVDHLSALEHLSSYFKDKVEREGDFVVVSPDLGGVTRTRKFANYLHLPIAIIEKVRPRPNENEVMNVIGDIEGKNVIMVDDIIDTGGTICKAAEALKERGAKKIYGAATHGVLSDRAVDRIQNSVLEEFVITNTIDQPEENKKSKIKIVSVGGLIAQAIDRIHNNESISVIFG
ncbi:MAG: ribose-phosphate pyrophosphokinase [Bacillota bacterium]|nr:ribose-phosphate pyrophosphokinase [Bacillota bacterium]